MFRLVVRVGAGLLLLGVVGCMSTAVNAVDTLQLTTRFKPTIPDASPDMIELHYIFLERDANDPLVNEQIWAAADEQAVPLDLKNTLANNGLRVGKLGSRLPPELSGLIKEQKGKEAARRHRAASGLLAKVQTTEVVPELNLFTLVNGQSRGEQIKDAQGYLYVTPVLADKQNISLKIVPQVEYGKAQDRRVPSPDLTGWQIRTEREARPFPDLLVNLPMISGEYALIGCHGNASASLGHRFFCKEVGGVPKKTVLLIRIVQPSRDELYTAGFDFDDFFLQPLENRPLAGRSTAREAMLATGTNRPNVH